MAPIVAITSAASMKGHANVRRGCVALPDVVSALKCKLVIKIHTIVGSGNSAVAQSNWSVPIG